MNLTADYESVVDPRQEPGKSGARYSGVSSGISESTPPPSSRIEMDSPHAARRESQQRPDWGESSEDELRWFRLWFIRMVQLPGQSDMEFLEKLWEGARLAFPTASTVLTASLVRAQYERGSAGGGLHRADKPQRTDGEEPETGFQGLWPSGKERLKQAATAPVSSVQQPREASCWSNKEKLKELTKSEEIQRMRGYAGPEGTAQPQLPADEKGMQHQENPQRWSYDSEAPPEEASTELTGEENLLAILKRRWWKYMILGLIDIEANYLVIKAYQYTTLTSVQLLDCFVIPVVLLLSWFFLLVRYKAVHFIGVGVCLLGMGCMVGADVLVGRQQGFGDHKLLGDLLVLAGATLYGISNVCEEFIVKNLSRVEFLGMIGLFGSFFSGIQLAIMEHKELLKVPWDWQIGLLYIGFSACMFGLYSFMPVVIKRTSATAVNLSLLTADLYSLFCGLFLFQYKFSGLYLLSFFVILLGLILYSSSSTYVAQDPRVYKQFRNPAGPNTDPPASGPLEPSVTYTSLGQETEEEPRIRVA
ncbi:S35F1 protein, partial [Amia calva]|nr:S35F1 protein [Amia calva]